MSRLTGRIREQADASRAREQRTASAYALSREMAAAREPPEIAAAATRHIEDAFAGRVTFLLVEPPTARLPAMMVSRAGPSSTARSPGSARAPCPRRRRSISRCRRRTGCSASCGSSPVKPADVPDPEQRQQLESLRAAGGGGARALRRCAERNQASRMEVEAERLRTSLLSSLSHDLRTPLGSIEGAASSLLDTGATLSPETRRELAETILDESRRMTRLVANLLDMIRVESGVARGAEAVGAARGSHWRGAHPSRRAAQPTIR